MVKKNLVICTTPLQILIAKKIIELEKSEFDAILVTNKFNEKYSYYFNELKKICGKSLFFNSDYGVSFKTVQLIIKLFYFKLKIKKLKYDKIYIASIDSFVIQSLLSYLSFENLYTFDDGTANINQNSNYYLKQSYSFKKLLLAKLVGNIYTKSCLVVMSKQHYTIYKNMTNIIVNTKFIYLFDIQNDVVEVNNSINIFLGLPLGELDSRLTFEYVEKLLKELEINQYYPHPREKTLDFDVEIIESVLIFEDYLINFLENNKNTGVTIYSFISSAAINVSSFKNVSNVFLYDDISVVKRNDFLNLSSSFGFLRKINIS
jgi:beta-galactosamide-alpha-2,3-sialyltransferase